jgi:PKD repeat protein
MKPVLILITSLIFILPLNCSFLSPDDSNKPQPNNDKITLGSDTTIKTVTIPSSGGEIVINNGILNGMDIEIPANAYTQSRTFTMSYAPIESHKLGQYFNPITPLIKISNGGGYSDSIMTVSIPINVPYGEFAMCYAYDDKTGKLEGLPLIDYKDGTITIGTRHFSTSNLSTTAKLAPQQSNIAYMNLVVSSIKESVLQGTPIIASNFIPGIDDWEFINFASIVATGGHCAGQSMAALWYYHTKRLNGAPKLFGLLDTEADLWQDNPLGYKFASTLQKDSDFEGWITYVTIQSYLDQFTFRAFAASIMTTGEPQSVLIRNSAGQGGHAMIIYKVDYLGGILYVADPNYPGNIRFNDKVETIRKIELVNNAFNAYPIGLTADANTIMMDQIGYAGKTAYIKWDKITARWQEVQDKTIGNDRFPECRCSLRVGGIGGLDTNWYAINKDTVSVANDTFQIECWVDYKTEFNDGFEDIYAYRGSNLLVGGIKYPYIYIRPLYDKIGIYIEKEVAGKKKWIDFKYITFKCSKLSIEPKNSVGPKNTQFNFTAQSGGTAPPQSKYEWDFGDGSAKITVLRDSTTSHVYNKEGNFIVKLKVFDNNNSTLFGEAEAYVEVTSGEMQIVSIQPYPPAIGDTIAIKGFGFGNGAERKHMLALTHYEQGEGKVWIGSTDSDILSWKDTEIKMVISDYKSICTGNIYLMTTSYPQEIASNKFKLQIKPKITGFTAYNWDGAQEDRTWTGTMFGISGVALTAYEAKGITSLGATILDGDISYNGFWINSFPSNATTGNVVVTVDGITSNSRYLKVGIEDWLIRSGSIDPYLSVEKIILKNSITGDTTKLKYALFSYLGQMHDDCSALGSIQWSGTSFDFNHSKPWATETLTLKMSGSTNADGSVLTSFSYFLEERMNAEAFISVTFKCTNIPLIFASHLGNFKYSLDGAEVESHITEIKLRQVGGTTPENSYDYSIDSIVYGATPRLTIEFIKK